MSIQTGTYTGNGTRQDVALGFRPEMVFTIPALAEHVGVKIDDFWCGRSNVLSATDSFIDGAKLTDDGFSLGQSVRMNANGTTYHYLALSRSAALKMAFAGLQGNAASGRVVKLDDATVTPAAVIGKRDSTRDGVLQVLTSTSALLGATALTESGAITSLATGQFTVSGSNYVNEYNPAAELGEGIDFVAFEAGANFAAVAYTGTGATQTVALGFQPKAVIVAKLSGSMQAGRIKTDTMGTDETKPLSNAAGATSDGVSFVATGIELTAGSSINTNTATYVVIGWRDHTETAIAAPAVVTTGKKAVLLPGAGAAAHIDCGTDASLVIDGALTLEWMGGMEPLRRNSPVPMLWRGNAVTNTSLSCSFAMYAGIWSGNSYTNQLRWSGPQIAIGCADRLDLAVLATEIRSSWRTGILPPFGEMTHFVATHDGSGGWTFYRNGLLVRQRALDLTSIPLPNIDGQSGHRMMIGGMYTGAAATNNTQRQRFMLGRVYDAELTPAEVATRFEIAGLGSGGTDPDTNLVEEWDAANASGSSVPATVSSANNGTITGGSVIDL